MSRLTFAAGLSDHDLLDATSRAAADERQRTVDLLALLGELDARRLYLAQSCASLFTFCTHVLHLSEHAAYHRIEAARAARQFPLILEMLADGALTLTTVALLRPHLHGDNHLALLEAARHKSKREVEHQIASLAPKPDERPTVRKQPTPAQAARPTVSASATAGAPTDSVAAHKTATFELAPRPRVDLAPLSADRYLLKITLSAETHARLRRAQDLTRHTIPTGDPAAVIDRALQLLIDSLERSKFAKSAAPRPSGRSARHPSTACALRSRHIPAAIRRAVWSRDGGRCAFVGPRGRCAEVGRLEFHHVIPFADGGSTSVGNLALRCRAHNRHEVAIWSPTDECSTASSAQ